jgi:hypothetical protein
MGLFIRKAAATVCLIECLRVDPASQHTRHAATPRGYLSRRQKERPYEGLFTILRPSLAHFCSTVTCGRRDFGFVFRIKVLFGAALCTHANPILA